MRYKDSTGLDIKEGDLVRFQGKFYTIKRFFPGKGNMNTAAIEFEEKEVHTTELPDEMNVDLAI